MDYEQRQSLEAERKRRAYVEAIQPIIAEQTKLYQIHAQVVMKVVDGMPVIEHVLPEPAQKIYDQLEELKILYQPKFPLDQD